MPSIQVAIAKNKARIAAGGETKTGIGSSQSPAPVAPTPPQDLPVGGGLPQRGMFPASTVLASDRSDSSRAFRGQGMRSAAFPYPNTGIQTSPKNTTTIVSSTPATPSSTTNEGSQILVNGI